MIVNKQTVLQNKAPFAILIVIVVLALLVVYEFLAVLGFSFDVSTRTLSFGLSQNPLEYFGLFLSLALLFFVYVSSTKRNETVFVAVNAFPFVVKQNTLYKLWLARHERKAPALLLIQFAFVTSVALAIYAYLDPELELVQWGKMGIFPPLTKLLNVILFAIVVAAFFYLYNFTASYRKATGKK